MESYHLIKYNGRHYLATSNTIGYWTIEIDSDTVNIPKESANIIVRNIIKKSIDNNKTNKCSIV